MEDQKESTGKRDEGEGENVGVDGEEGIEKDNKDVNDAKSRGSNARNENETVESQRVTENAAVKQRLVFVVLKLVQ